MSSTKTTTVYLTEMIQMGKNRPNTTEVHNDALLLAQTKIIHYKGNVKIVKDGRNQLEITKNNDETEIWGVRGISGNHRFFVVKGKMLDDKIEDLLKYDTYLYITGVYNTPTIYRLTKSKLIELSEKGKDNATGLPQWQLSVREIQTSNQNRNPCPSTLKPSTKSNSFNPNAIIRPELIATELQYNYEDLMSNKYLKIEAKYKNDMNDIKIKDIKLTIYIEYVNIEAKNKQAEYLSIIKEYDQYLINIKNKKRINRIQQIKIIQEQKLIEIKMIQYKDDKEIKEIKNKNKIRWEQNQIQQNEIDKQKREDERTKKIKTDRIENIKQDEIDEMNKKLMIFANRKKNNNRR